MILPDVPIVELILRFLVAMIATVATFILWVSLERRLLEPRALFIYMGCIVAGTAVWRWFIVFLAYAEDNSLPSELLTSVQPINAALLSLLLISIALLALWRVREGSSHE